MRPRHIMTMNTKSEFSIDGMVVHTARRAAKNNFRKISTHSPNPSPAHENQVVMDGDRYVEASGQLKSF